MTSLIQLPQNSILFQHGQLLTTSLKVAEAFGKRHTHVLDKIKTLECSEKFTSANFSVHDQEVTIGNGATRRSKVYEMTKDGFIFLVMGFTGKKAAQVKEAYINAFNQMYERLFGKAKPALTPQQQRHIQTRVAELAHQPGNSFAAVYASIKNKFQVGSYKDVSGSQYPDLCNFLQCEPLQGELLEPEGSAPVPDSTNTIAFADMDFQAMHLLLVYFGALDQRRTKLHDAAVSLESPLLMSVFSFIKEASPTLRAFKSRHGERLALLHEARLSGRKTALN